MTRDSSPDERPAQHGDDPLDALARSLGPFTPGRLISASEVAVRLAVSRDWVYAHAGELGVLRLGGGQRPRLRFDPQLVGRALEAGLPDAVRTARPRARRPKPRCMDVELLPIGPTGEVPSRRGRRS